MMVVMVMMEMEVIRMARVMRVMRVVMVVEVIRMMMMVMVEMEVISMMRVMTTEDGRRGRGCTTCIIFFIITGRLTLGRKQSLVSPDLHFSRHRGRPVS